MLFILMLILLDDFLMFLSKRIGRALDGSIACLKVSNMSLQIIQLRLEEILAIMGLLQLLLSQVSLMLGILVVV